MNENVLHPPVREYAETVESPDLNAMIEETRPAQAQYRVTYKRVGRRHDIPPLTVVAAGADHLAELIYRDARPYLRSRDVEVSVDLETMRGIILVGWNNGGTFTIERIDGGQA